MEHSCTGGHHNGDIHMENLQLLHIIQRQEVLEYIHHRWHRWLSVVNNFDNFRLLRFTFLNIWVLCNPLLDVSLGHDMVCLCRRVLVYPKGNCVDHMSAYLDVAGASELPLGWSRLARFKLTVRNELDRRRSITKGILFALYCCVFSCLWFCFCLLYCHCFIFYEHCVYETSDWCLVLWMLWFDSLLHLLQNMMFFVFSF